MYIPIPDKGSNRINAAYQLGGPALSIKTVNTNFDLDITRYAIVDFCPRTCNRYYRWY